MSVLIVGSIALDDVKTPLEERQNLLGGAACYASIAASFFSPVQIVGIVGSDFPEEYFQLLASRPIDLEGLQIVEGKTFHWSGQYHNDMNSRETLSTNLNVLADFTPTLPQSYRSTPYVLLGNIAPSLHHHVLDQIESPRFVIADTMNFWIETAREDLLRLLKRIDLLILNESEARLLTGAPNLIRAGKLIRKLGARFVIINKGEHGSILFGEDEFFSCPAYPLEEIHDPTGAGDSFAGGFAGYLASTKHSEITFDQLCLAVVYGTLLASFNVESFSVERLTTLSFADIEKRHRSFHSIRYCEPGPAARTTPLEVHSSLC